MRIYDLLSYKEKSQKEEKEYVEVQHTQNGRIRVQHEGNRGMTYSTEYQYVL